jgi:hypothetical protein
MKYVVQLPFIAYKVVLVFCGTIGNCSKYTDAHICGYFMERFSFSALHITAAS